MNRQLRTTLPNAADHNLNNSARATKERSKQKEHYDKGSKPLRELNENETVRIRNDNSWSKKAIVVEKMSPRAYKVKTEDGVMYNRNRRHLLPTKEKFQETPDDIVVHIDTNKMGCHFLVLPRTSNFAISSITYPGYREYNL